MIELIFKEDEFVKYFYTEKECEYFINIYCAKNDYYNYSCESVVCI